MPRRKRTFWVYFGTARVYDGRVDEKNLTQIHKKNNEIKSAKLALTPEYLIHLERVSDTCIRHRKEVWVYLDTNTTYPHEFNPQNLTHQQTKNGYIYRGKLHEPDNNRVVELELITVSAQSKRKQVWVHLGTDRVYPDAFNPQDLKDPAMKKNHIYRGKLHLPGNRVIELELISLSALRGRKEVWVYSGTGRVYPDAFNPLDLTEKKFKNEYICQGKLHLPGNRVVKLELISTIAQFNRKEVWVYLNTGRVYPHEFNPQNLIEKKTKNEYIYQGKLLDSNNRLIELELISYGAQCHRKEVWVYINTSTAYPHKFDPLYLEEQQFKNGYIHQGKLRLSNNSVINLELISTNEQSQRYVRCISKKNEAPDAEETQSHKRMKLTISEKKSTQVDDYFAELILVLSQPILNKAEIDAKLMACLNGEISKQEQILDKVTNSNNNNNGFFDERQATINGINYYLQILKNVKNAASQLASEGGVYYSKDRLSELFSLVPNGDGLGSVQGVQHNADYNTFATFLANVMKLLITPDLESLFDLGQ